MQSNPFDRTAREERLSELCKEHDTIARAVFDLQMALDEGALAEIALAREAFRDAARSHISEFEINACLRLIEEMNSKPTILGR